MTDDFIPLSDREIEVLKLVAAGKTNQQIARDLVISPNTVKVHLRNIFEKLGVQSRTEATMTAVRRGWVDVPGVPDAAIMADAISTLGIDGEAEQTESASLDESETVEGGAGASASVDAAGGATAAETAIAAPDRPAEPAPARHPIASWQRLYLFLIAGLIIAAALAPDWHRSRSQAAIITPFSDAGLATVPPAPRPQVSRWIARAPLSEASNRSAVTTDGVRLYVIGGEAGGGVSGQVLIYDPRATAWQTGAPKPTAVANASAAWLKNRIYVPGGTTAAGKPTNAVEVYDPQADRWEAVAPLPVPLTAYAMAPISDTLYLFGGWNGAGYQAGTWVYDPVSASWSSGAAMADPRAFFAAAALNGLIYVAGGYEGQRELATVVSYDPARQGTGDDPWAPHAALIQPRGGLAMVSFGSRLYAIGGGWAEPLSFNEQYDTRTGAWSRIETPVVGQWRNLGLVALGNKLYAVGGWNGSRLNSVEEYQALLQQLLPLFTKSE